MKLYKTKNQCLITGPGYITKLLPTFSYEINLEENDKFTNINFNGVLFDYQEKALRLITEIFRINKYFRGIISSPTGSGKTVMAVAIAAMTKKKILWIVNSNDLMEQAAQSFEKFTNTKCGRLNSKYKEIKDNFDICISTIQTLGKLNNEDYNIINDTYDCVIIDECHHTPAKFFMSAISKLTPIFMMGLTATPIRKDSMQETMFNIIGDIIYKIDRNDIKENLIFPKVNIIKIREMIECFVSSDNYVEYMKEVVFNNRRLEISLEIFEKYHKSKALLLVEFVELGEIYKNKLRKIYPNKNIEFIHGSMKKKDREEIIERARNEEIDILIGTKLAREGLDIPCLDELFLFTPKKGDSFKNTPDGTSLEQEIGRIMRKWKNKKSAIVVDIVDYNFEIFKRQFYSRNKTYKRLELEVKQIMWSKPQVNILGIDIY